MNTEQLKTDRTKEEFLQAEFDKIGKGNTTQVQFCYKAIFNAMNSFASQESKRAVDEFKEKLKELIRNEMKPEIVGIYQFYKDPDFLFGCEKCLDLIDKL